MLSLVVITRERKYKGSGVAGHDAYANGTDEKVTCEAQQGPGSLLAPWGIKVCRCGQALSALSSALCMGG